MYNFAGKTPQEIQAMKPQLLEAAKRMGIKVHPNAKAETILSKIQQTSPKPEVKMTEPKKETKEPIFNTEEQVMEAVKDYINRDGFSVKFPGDGTWIFEYKIAGIRSQDSGSLSVPLRVIKHRAGLVSRPKKLATMRDGMGNDIMVVGR